MIKYLGSKRRLVPVLGELFAGSGARTGLDLFTGTTRVAQEMCRRGMDVTAVDTASYSEVLAQCYVEADADTVDAAEVAEALDRLACLEPVRGYVTEVFCERSRYFQPRNGMRIDAVRQGIDDLYGDSPLRSLLLTSLLRAADAVDSTVGVQMAYLKEWSRRSARELVLRPPVLTPGRDARSAPTRRASSTTCRTWTSPTSTRRTTSTATSRTTTSGRRSSAGTAPSRTGSRPSAPTAGTP